MKEVGEPVLGLVQKVAVLHEQMDGSEAGGLGLGSGWRSLRHSQEPSQGQEVHTHHWSLTNEQVNSSMVSPSSP